MSNQTVLQALVAASLAAEKNLAVWQPRLAQLMDLMPSGGGVDAGTRIVSVSEKRVVFWAAFHHMNDAGYYDGWTEHEIVVTPAFDGFNIRVTGRNRNDIKEYFASMFYCVLSAPAPAPNVR